MSLTALEDQRLVSVAGTAHVVVLLQVASSFCDGVVAAVSFADLSCESFPSGGALELLGRDI